MTTDQERWLATLKESWAILAQELAVGVAIMHSRACPWVSGGECDCEASRA